MVINAKNSNTGIIQFFEASVFHVTSVYDSSAIGHRCSGVPTEADIIMKSYACCSQIKFVNVVDTLISSSLCRSEACLLAGCSGSGDETGAGEAQLARLNTKIQGY